MTRTDLRYYFDECVKRNGCESYDEVMEALIEMDELADITEDQEYILERWTAEEFPN